MRTSSVFVVAMSVGCYRAANDDSEATNDGFDSDTPTLPHVTCDTTLEEVGPCTVDADGDGAYLSIQEAIDASSEGDVITVCPGNYDAVVIDSVGITLRGYSAESTCIVGRSRPAITVQSASAGTWLQIDISGFTLSAANGDASALAVQFATGGFHDVRVTGVPAATDGGGHAAVIGPSQLTWDRVTVDANSGESALLIGGGTHVIRHSIFRLNGKAVYWNGYPTEVVDDEITVTNSIFIDNTVGISSYLGSVTIVNNVFYRNEAGVQHAQGPAVIRNNVALANTDGFLIPSDADYNVAWDNNRDWVSPNHGLNDQTVDPRFEDETVGDFRLQPGSPLIDAGDPDGAYLDPNGTRNDIGAFGGPGGNWVP